MLGFSLPKILVLAAIVALVWYGFKIFGRGRALEKSIKKGDISAENEKQNVDLEECPICEAYVDAGAASCGKNDCPLPLG
jgi:tRNA U54 and U55 pseudouridine synthase Pus10